MANLVKYGNQYSHLTINGVEIVDWGETDPPLSLEDLAPRATLKRGTGSRSVRIDSATRPRRLTINLIPGSEQVRQLISIEKTAVDFEAKWTQSDTGESVDCFNGIITSRGPLGRAGRSSVTDEQLIFEFNDSEET